ncbi:hypothetical protein P4909_05610 [Escherichia coli]
MKKYTGEMKRLADGGRNEFLMAIWIRCHIW